MNKQEYVNALRSIPLYQQGSSFKNLFGSVGNALANHPYAVTGAVTGALTAGASLFGKKKEKQDRDRADAAFNQIMGSPGILMLDDQNNLQLEDWRSKLQNSDKDVRDKAMNEINNYNKQLLLISPSLWQLSNTTI